MIEPFFASRRSRSRRIFLGSAACFAVTSSIPLGRSCAETNRRSPRCRIEPAEILIDATGRRAKGLDTWPDGTMGVLRNGDLLDMYAANGSAIAKTCHDTKTGAFHAIYAGKTITGLRDHYSYAAGGPVMRQANGDILLMYHAEKNPRHLNESFYSSLGIAKSTDNGGTFSDLGAIITPNIDAAASPAIVEIGGGGFVNTGGKTRVYFREQLQTGEKIGLAMAENTGPSLSGDWQKYFNDSFSEPGLGGASTLIGGPGLNPSWFSVAYCRDVDALVIAYAERIGDRCGVYLAWSADGLTWSEPQVIETNATEAYYPSLIGTGENPTILGESFYIYYTVSERGGFGRWMDASVARRKVQIE